MRPDQICRFATAIPIRCIIVMRTGDRVAKSGA
jgi:hypothetical protein